MLTIRKELTLQKELQIAKIFVIIEFVPKCQNTTTKQKSNHKNHCQSLELNPGLLAPESDALSLDNGDN